MASVLFGSADTICSIPLSMVYYPLGKCILSGSDDGVVYTADNAGNVRLYTFSLSSFAALLCLVDSDPCLPFGSSI